MARALIGKQVDDEVQVNAQVEILCGLLTTTRLLMIVVQHKLCNKAIVSSYNVLYICSDTTITV